MAIKERLEQLVASQHLNQQEFAKMIGLSPATLSSIKKGRTQLTVNTINAIRKTLPTINVDWLMSGNGQMFVADNETTPVSSTPSSSPEAVIDFGDSADHAASAGQRQANPQGVHSTLNHPQIIAPKIINNKQRKITEIMVFYDDNTVESFVPKK